MNFGFDEQQDLLRREVRKFLDEQCPLEEVRRISKTPEGYSPEQWKQLAELGWLGLILPEDCGGAGLGWVDLMVLLEEVGRSLYPMPLISTLLAGVTLADLGTPEQRARILPGMVEGTCIGALALFDHADLLGPAGVSLRAPQRVKTVGVRGSFLGNGLG